ncbi:hypothetical protein NC651_030173 [Populus alba x Populus x berolinensis]|nr:hypothetical protein NC651_030173 [Populus alba x Populus x berolinensis]
MRPNATCVLAENQKGLFSRGRSEAVILKAILASSQDNHHHKPGMRSRKKNVAKNNLPTDSSLLDYAYIDGSKSESSASHPWLHQSL